MIPSSFTSILKDIAEETIPKTSAVPKRFNKPWFSDICKDLRLSKKTSWRNYISKLNSQASVISVWNRTRKNKGKESSYSIHHLSVNDRDVTSHRDIANALADNVSHNSSSAFSTDAFASVRCKAEKQNITFSSELYSRPFSLEELQDALRRAHDTSAGPDEIHYQLLKHLPDASLTSFKYVLIKSGSLVTFLLIGGKLLSFRFQSLVRTQLFLVIIALLLWQIASVKP